MLKSAYSKEVILNESIIFNTLFKASPPCEAFSYLTRVMVINCYYAATDPTFSYSVSAHVKFFPPSFDLQTVFIDFSVIFSLSLET
ncbi:hypothetical protein D0437_16625 [Bacillus cereus]|uniref:Uncharacterized protein n=1 Tax=Bacillus cereus TaxID=1396 RepID=A0A9X7LX72_BACCE|nr:hypothetical protein D0437_16625 [Bacillus cereus]